MNSIPVAALHFGAESLFNAPISYGKSRVAGSNQVTYILHSKGGCMPGQPNLFSKNSLSKPDLIEELHNNQIMSSFKREKSYMKLQKLVGNFPGLYQDEFTFKKFNPHDDDNLKLALNACYKQVFGNLNLMESEKPIDLERRLRNGDIPIREFIRSLTKTDIYIKNYFEKVSQQRCIELSFKHLLGRPPMNQKEIITHIEIMNNEGFRYSIDKIIDSPEYHKVFGQDIVPYERSWNSPVGLKTACFNNAALLHKGFAISDNAIDERSSYPESIGGKSQLIQSLVNGVKITIEVPSLKS